MVVPRSKAELPSDTVDISSIGLLSFGWANPTSHRLGAMIAGLSVHPRSEDSLLINSLVQQLKAAGRDPEKSTLRKEAFSEPHRIVVPHRFTHVVGAAAGTNLFWRANFLRLTKRFQNLARINLSDCNLRIDSYLVAARDCRSQILSSVSEI